jgi:hypothetical protein
MEQKHCSGYIRYMDDFVIWSNSKDMLFELWTEIDDFVKSELKLRLKISGSFVKPVPEGLHFLGILIYPGCIRMQHKRLKRARKLLHIREEQYRSGEINFDELANSVRAIVSAKEYFGMGKLFTESLLLI